MENKIKFRSFYNNSSMLYSESYVSLYFFFELQPERFPFMKFTGLKDKNGKDIYQGDIMKSLGTDVCVVRWIDKLACFMLENINPTDDFDNILFPLHKGYENREVVGNIFENPELPQSSE